MNLSELAVVGFDLVADLQVRRCLRRVQRQAKDNETLDDADLVARCQAFIAAPKVGFEEQGGRPMLYRYAPIDEGDSDALALAVEAFRRFPPGRLPRGSRLFPAQIEAAAHLLHGAIVQMDTGEGKTFAIATAALARLRRYRRVYVITANAYLASRDTMQTSSFWAALGVSVGCGLSDYYEGHDKDAWKAQVVYTTLSALAYRSQEEDLGLERELRWEAVIVDEADAVLLDEGSQRYTIVRAVDSDVKDWTAPLRIAALLDDDDVKLTPGVEPSAHLTPHGEAKTMRMAGLGENDGGAHLSLLHDVELTCVALKAVREGHDYVVQGGRLILLDPATGWRDLGRRRAWMYPLERHLGLEGQPRFAVRHIVDGICLLHRFHQVSAISGTVTNEAFEYLLLLGLLPAVVKPREPRAQGRERDLFADTRDRALEWVIEQVREEGAKRPILIVTDLTSEASELARQIAEEKIEGVSVTAVTDETITASRVFEDAGRPGITIVSTRVGGRGVDIPLDPRARDSGGAMLLVISHSRESRFDRQLLGRVGRQGAPFTARFINYPGDPVLSQVGDQEKLERRFAMHPDGVMSNSLLDRSVSRLQANRRREHLRSFALGVSRSGVREESYEMLRRWRRNLGPSSKAGELPESFFHLLADAYLATHYPGLQSEGAGDASRIAAELAGLVGDEPGADDLVVAAAGRSSADLRALFLDYLAGRLAVGQDRNREGREELGARVAAHERAILNTRLLSLLLQLLKTSRDSEAPGLDDLLSLTASAAEAAPGKVDSSTLGAHLRSVEAWLGGATAEASRSATDGSLDGEAELGRLVALAANRWRRSGWGPADEGALEGQLRQALQAQASVDGASETLELERGRRLRSMWLIASETIDKATERVSIELDRAWFQVGQTASPTRFNVAYRARVDDLRRENEAMLAEELCRNLTAGEDLESLDELFLERENEAKISRPRTELSLPTLPVPSPNLLAPAPEEGELPVSSGRLILDYVELRGAETGGEVDWEQVTLQLRSCLEATEIATMIDSDGVATAYDRWRRKARRELPLWKRRGIDREVRGFLRYLHERGLAAPLPEGIRQRSQSWLRRVGRALKSPNFMLAWAVLAIGVVGSAVLAVLPAGATVSPAEGAAFLDRLLTGGSLAAGSLLGPVLLAITAGAWVRWAVGGPVESLAGLTLPERAASWALLAVGVVFVVAPWHESDVVLGIAKLAACVLLLAGGSIVLNSVSWFEQMTSYPVSAGLVAGLAGLSALPFLAGVAGADSVWPAAVLAFVLLIATRPWRRFRLRALALHADEPLGNETLEVSLAVEARLSVVQHAFALLLAWAVACVAMDDGAAARAVVAGVAYLSVLGVWAWLLSKSATDVEGWQERLRKRDRGLVPSRVGESLGDLLARARRVVFVREIALAALLTLLGTWLALNAPEPSLAQLPVGMAVVFCAVVLSDVGLSVLRGLRSPLAEVSEPSSRATYSEGENFSALLRETVNFTTKKMGIAITIFLALAYIADAISVATLIKEAAEWVVTEGLG